MTTILPPNNEMSFLIDRFAQEQHRYTCVVMLAVTKQGEVAFMNNARDVKDMAFLASFLDAVSKQNFLQPVYVTQVDQHGNEKKEFFGEPKNLDESDEDGND